MSSILFLVEPLESAVPAAEDALALAALMLRTAGGLGALIAIFMLFRPLLTGVWHAAVITVKPRLSLQQRVLRQRYQSTSMLNHADENNISQADPASESNNLPARE